MVYMCKIIISPGSFFIFSKFWFFGLLGGWGVGGVGGVGRGGGVKGQKMVQMTKNSVCHASYLRNHTFCDYHLCYTCVNDNISRCFFHFFKVLKFRVVKGEGKRAKNGQKWQKILSVMLHISGAIHHMIVIYGIHV